jgi:hypothetical protein
LIIPKNIFYQIIVGWYKGVDADVPFEADMYFNDIKVVHFGQRESNFSLLNWYKPLYPIQDSTKNRLTNIIINEIKIVFNWNKYKYPKLFYLCKDFVIDFYFKEKLPLWVINKDSDICVICYEETNFTTNCKPVNHYTCESCINKISKCAYCKQELTSDRDVDLDTSLLF